ncbi:MAG: DUF2281 domain-containing protein [Treponema sp.]|nr:DUF2281 domain-containing protein [Treponema sp.]
MTNHAILLENINNLSPKYFSEVIDFVEYLKKKTQEDHENEIIEYKLMAADIEREKEAQEWCNSYFGHVSNS